MVLFAGSQAAAAQPPAPVPALEQDGVVGPPPTPVEPIALPDFLGLAFFIILTGAVIWAVKRFDLLRRRTTAHDRYDAIAQAVQPPGSTMPRNIGLMLVMGAMALWFLSGLASSLPSLSVGPDDPDPDPITMAALAIGSMSAVAVLAIAIAWIAWHPLGRMLGMPTSVRSLIADLKLGALATVLAMPPVLLVAASVALILALLAQAGVISPPDPLAHDLLRDLFSAPRTGAWWAVIAIVIVAVPIAEELIYRGLLQTGFRAAAGTGPTRRTGRLDWFALGLTAGLFTIVHLPVVSAHSMPILLALALIMGLAYERTGRITVPIMIHTGFNGLNILFSQFA